MTYTFGLAPNDFEDWAELHQLLMDCFAYMEGRIDPPSSLLKLTPELLREKSASETLLIVSEGLDLIGCAFFQSRHDALYIGKVAVHRKHRRNGITRQIFELAADIARQHGKQYLELQTRVELHENHQTFARLGFTKSGDSTHAGFQRPTSITMQKAI